MNNLVLVSLAIATWQTIYMVFIASFLSIFFGLWCGVGLFISSSGQVSENLSFNRVFGNAMNIVRSTPFIILLICIIPFTRLIIGTAIGTNAAIVPLTIAAIPFFARITESALKEVNSNLIEAALAMGATYWQIIHKVLIPEAKSSLVRGATITTIALIGYSAMAGIVGGGGLGELAVNYGYQRFNPVVMIETVTVLVIIVQSIQQLGDYLATKRNLKLVLIIFSIVFAGLISTQLVSSTAAVLDEIKVGIKTGLMEEVMAVAQNVAEKQFNLRIKIVPFNDYILPNTALNNGEIDANIFQHLPYLEAQNKANNYHLISIAKTFVYPMGFYSRKLSNIKQLKNGSIVAIPNDPSNEGRALLILQKENYIKLQPNVGLFSTPSDIISNPYSLQFRLLDSAQLPRVFADADIVALTNDHVKVAGFTSEQALIRENADSPYANIVVIRESDKDKAVFKKLVEAVHSSEVEQITKKLFPGGAAIPAWK